MKWQLGSPSGWRGEVIEAGSAEEAIAVVEAAPYRERVLDVMDWQDEDGQPIGLLVVADEYQS